MSQSLPMTSIHPELNSANGDNDFERLATRLSHVVTDSRSTDVGDIDHVALQRIMEEYETNEEHWSKYAYGDPSRAYTRNLVNAGNGKSNLLILVWSPDKGSPIHDHTNAHCVMKVLKGRLREIRYAWPSESSGANAAATNPMEQIAQTELAINDVSYMSDTLGVHRIANPDPHTDAVSLHLYTPPSASVEGCYVFDRWTGQRSHVPNCNIYSAYGNKL